MFRRRRREPDPEEPEGSGQEDEDDEAPGWEAIDERLRTVYPEGEPRHMAGTLPVALGGGKFFAPGHRRESSGPIDGASSPFSCLAFTKDPDLGSMDGPFGFVGFLQMVGITARELAEMKASSTDAVLDRFRATNPKLVSWPSR
jgi:hypothetical protein